MKITVCGSMSFAQEMLNIQKELDKAGHTVVLPEGAEEYAEDKELLARVSDRGTHEGAERKMANDFIRKHYQEIAGSDAILVINKDKDGIKNYLGGNSFLEVGFAYILKKPIYLLNSIPEELPIFYQELVAMRPIVLDGDLSKIKLDL